MTKIKVVKKERICQERKRSGFRFFPNHLPIEHGLIAYSAFAKSAGSLFFKSTRKSRLGCRRLSGFEKY